MPKCKACGKKIAFIETEKGKKMPVDAEKTTIVRQNGEVQTGPELKLIVNEHGEMVAGYVPHWSTCSSPDKFRKGDK